MDLNPLKIHREEADNPGSTRHCNFNAFPRKNKIEKIRKIFFITQDLWIFYEFQWLPIKLSNDVPTYERNGNECSRFSRTRDSGKFQWSIANDSDILGVLADFRLEKFLIDEGDKIFTTTFNSTDWVKFFDKKKKENSHKNHIKMTG